MMYQKLTSEECEKIKIIEKITKTNYEMSGEFIPSDSFMPIINDLFVELEKKSQKIEELREYKELYCDLCD